MRYSTLAQLFSGVERARERERERELIWIDRNTIIMSKVSGDVRARTTFLASRIEAGS